jgi:lysozyme family protein
MSIHGELYNIMIVNPDKVDDLEHIIVKIKANKGTYDEVSTQTSVPWYTVAAIHYRESGLSFKHHLHNGDPLTERTVHIPKGRPIKGAPPFTWKDSAIDALNMSWLSKNKDWSIGNTLALIERYNGLGYQKKGLPSPYIWSWTNQYHKGKYVEDGKFDPNAVDQQCGAAVIIKSLL